jgi:microcystin-dependent protein
MDISGSYRHRDVIFPFWDAPDVPVRVIWYEVPRTALPLGTPTIFCLRDWDRRNNWIEPSLGSKYTTPEPYTGPDPVGGCTTPTGTADEWLNGLSYAAYLDGQNYRGVLSGKGQLSATVAEIIDVRVIGETIDYAGASIPPGWLECLGQAVSRVTYAALFAELGITWGPGDGSTTFNLPPGAGVSMIGAGTDGDGNTFTVGDLAGANTTALGQSNMPAYDLLVNDPGHSHGVTDPGHSHNASQLAHNHFVNDAGHSHGITQSKHKHTLPATVNAGAGPNFKIVGNSGGASSGIVSGDENANVTVDSALTGITTAVTTPAITVDDEVTSLSVDSATTGLTVNSDGGGVPISRRPPQAVMRRLIWPGP